MEVLRSNPLGYQDATVLDVLFLTGKRPYIYIVKKMRDSMLRALWSVLRFSSNPPPCLRTRMTLFQSQSDQLILSPRHGGIDQADSYWIMKGHSRNEMTVVYRLSSPMSLIKNITRNGFKLSHLSNESYGLTT